MKLYPYAKLRKAAKAKALEDWRQQDNWDWFDDDVVKDDFRERGKERGFEIGNIYWSGFWSQGDGASWEGHIDLRTWVEWKRKNGAQDVYLTVLEALLHNEYMDPTVCVSCKRTNDCHENTMYLEDYPSLHTFDPIQGGIFDGAESEMIYDTIPHHEIEKDWLSEARAYAKEFYKALEEEYEHQTSEEHFAELCKANDWTFTASGRFVRN